MSDSPKVVPSPYPTTAAVTTAEVEPITAEELVEALRALKARVPGFTQLTTPNRKALATINLHPLFKEAAISAVGASEVVTNSVRMTATEMQQIDADVERWAPAISEARTLLEGLITANLQRRHRVGLAALQSYSITRQLVRHADHKELLPHMQQMKRTSRFGRKTRKDTAPAPGPLPQTA